MLSHKEKNQVAVLDNDKKSRVQDKNQGYKVKKIQMTFSQLGLNYAGSIDLVPLTSLYSNFTLPKHMNPL